MSNNKKALKLLKNVSFMKNTVLKSQNDNPAREEAMPFENDV